MKVAVRILPRSEVLDTQGRAVEKTLKSHQFDLNQCRIGRYVVLDLPASSKDQALSQAKQMAEFVLHNPLIEQYELEVLT